MEFVVGELRSRVVTEGGIELLSQSGERVCLIRFRSAWDATEFVQNAAWCVDWYLDQALVKP